MSIPDRRKKVYREILELKGKPYLSADEHEKLAALRAEWNRLLLCGDQSGSSDS